MRGLRGIGIGWTAMGSAVIGGVVSAPPSYGSGEFDAWVTDQIWVESVAPKTGSTGDMDAWATDQIWIGDYGSI